MSIYEMNFLSSEDLEEIEDENLEYSVFLNSYTNNFCGILAEENCWG